MRRSPKAGNNSIRRKQHRSRYIFTGVLSSADPEHAGRTYRSGKYISYRCILQVRAGRGCEFRALSPPIGASPPRARRGKTPCFAERRASECSAAGFLPAVSDAGTRKASKRRFSGKGGRRGTASASSVCQKPLRASPPLRRKESRCFSPAACPSEKILPSLLQARSSANPDAKACV